MKAATQPRSVRSAARLMHLDPSTNGIQSGRALDLAEHLEPGDLVVVNDAGTLPASLRLPGLDAELRLAGHGRSGDTFRAVLFGAGDYRTPTEHRPEPPRVSVGQRLELGGELHATVTDVDATLPRLIEVRFSESPPELYRALYRCAKPIQYAHVPAPLEMWDVQNRYAARPWAFELPSAGYAIDGELLLSLARRGIVLATLTHAAGISSTGSARLDARLPLPERYEIPERTAQAIARTRKQNRRVLAVGTSVVRALESSALEHSGSPAAGGGVARLVIGPGFCPRVVHGILSGLHEIGTSHFALLGAFAPRALLERAIDAARELGYTQHEFGDACLVWPPRANAMLAATPARTFFLEPLSTQRPGTCAPLRYR